jgi:hypothetical protein
MNTLSGDLLTLCRTNTVFNAIGSIDFRYSLAYGLYSIDRPGINQKPVYFYFTYGEGIWWTGAPDMGIFYGTYDPSASCPNLRKEIKEDNFTQQCMPCDFAPQTMTAITSTNVRDYLATTDYSTIYGYWSDCVITVGFVTEMSGQLTSGSTPNPDLNLYYFYGQNSPTPCTPTGTKIGELTLSPAGEYEVGKRFFSNYSYIPGTVVNIHVVADFNNGESIDECVNNVPLLSNSGGNNLPFKGIVSVIRGDIKDYSSSSLKNY